MTNMFTIWIEGIPQPQGSKKAFIINQRAILVDATAGNKNWRKTVRDAIEKDPKYRQFKGAVNASFVFNMPKAKSNTKPQMIQKPDIDKLIRSVMDSLTDSALIEDDCRVVSISAQKIWSTDDKPGVFIAVWPNDDTPTT
jgi:Holliday junction resolvase RusA-like endonuclease